MRTMELSPYDPDWVQHYENERRILQEIFGDLIAEIHHFGSTSVEGLWAKPIIDVMIFVWNLGDIESYNKRMETAGFTVRGENGVPGRRYYVRMKEDGLGNHLTHVHLYDRQNSAPREELLFRDYLRMNPQARQEYQDIKMDLSRRFNTSPKEYTDGKTACIQKLLAEAKNI